MSPSICKNKLERQQMSVGLQTIKPQNISQLKIDIFLIRTVTMVAVDDGG